MPSMEFVPGTSVKDTLGATQECAGALPTILPSQLAKMSVPHSHLTDHLGGCELNKHDKNNTNNNNNTVAPILSTISKAQALAIERLRPAYETAGGVLDEYAQVVLARILIGLAEFILLKQTSLQRDLLSVCQ